MTLQAAKIGDHVPLEVIEAIARSWCVLPVQVGGKTPLIGAWPQRASRDPAIVADWSKQFAGCNWGLLTGPRSNLFVVDCDGEVGKRELYRLESQGLTLPETRTVLTGRGKHLYFNLPQNLCVRNSAGYLAPGLDIRGNGGFVVMPPSKHECGQSYRYEREGVEVTDAPPWLLDRLSSPVRTSRSPVHEGYRNTELTRIAGRQRRRGASREQIENILMRANTSRCHPPLEQAEIMRIAASVSRYPTKGADILDLAWQKVKAENNKTKQGQFRALIFHLSALLPGEPIALPLERIAEHIGCNWTLIRRYRKYAVDAGVILPLENCIPHAKAATFIVQAAG